MYKLATVILINATHLCSFTHRALHPSILWAQRNDTILLTVSLNDIHHEKYSLEEKVFQFTGVGGAEGQHYNVELEFFKDVIPQVGSDQM